ncbi:MAG: hypothetical protein DCC52_13555 [Chloroflexi bacterium]|nr:MAG: hypothetical protein DCC52_13555 [Chloroflexota bacterium]
MATLLETYAQQLTARQTDHVAKLLDVKPDALQKGLDLAGALLLGAVRQRSQTPQDAADLLASLERGGFACVIGARQGIARGRLARD